MLVQRLPDLIAVRPLILCQLWQYEALFLRKMPLQIALPKARKTLGGMLRVVRVVRLGRDVQVPCLNQRVMVIAEDYAFPYSQVQGFMAEYCRLGGKVPEKAWVPLGGKDYSSVIAKIPKNVDALLVVLGGADAVNFLTQYENAGGDKPMLGGSITVSHDAPHASLAGKAVAIEPATGFSFDTPFEVRAR